MKVQGESYIFLINGNTENYREHS